MDFFGESEGENLTPFQKHFYSLAPRPKKKLNFDETPTAKFSDTEVLKLDRYKDTGSLPYHRAAEILESYLYSAQDVGLAAYVVLRLAMGLDNPDKSSISEVFLTHVGGTTDFPDLNGLNVVKQSGKSVQLLSGGNQDSTFDFFSADPGEKKDESKEIVVETPLAKGADTEYDRSAKFCAAFCIRALVKKSSSVKTSWENLGARYRTFYGRTMHPTFSKPAEESKIDDLKEKLNADPMIATTWILAFNKIETSANQKTNRFKMIRYLCILPLAYSGMHAIKLFLEVREKLSCKYYWLEEKLYCPFTGKAILQINEIFQNWYPTDDDTKQTQYFKYARLFDSGFYQSLQTRKALSLIYVLVQIMKESGDITPGSDPSQIHDLDQVKGRRKDFLDNLATGILNKMPELQSEMYSDVAQEAAKKTELKYRQQPSIKASTDFFD
nr:TPA_asm: N [Sesamum betacytorhabdovirus 1_Ses]